MIRIITVASRFLLVVLIISSIISGVAYLMKWPQSTSAAFIGLYFAITSINYSANRIYPLKLAWDKLSKQSPQKKNVIICLTTAMVFLLSIFVTRFFDISVIFRIINISFATVLCFLMSSLLYYSNLQPLQKFWHFMIAKPKEIDESKTQKPDSN